MGLPVYVYAGNAGAATSRMYVCEAKRRLRTRLFEHSDTNAEKCFAVLLAVLCGTARAPCGVLMSTAVRQFCSACLLGRDAQQRRSEWC